MESKNVTENPASALGEVIGTAGSAGNANAFEDEIPGWIWVLTIQGDVPEGLEVLMDEDDVEDEFGGDIVGCYLTKELMKEDMKRLGRNRYGIFHMKLEGWMATK